VQFMKLLISAVFSNHLSLHPFSAPCFETPSIIEQFICN
jgi:hypothetical protein